MDLDDVRKPKIPTIIYPAVTSHERQLVGEEALLTPMLARPASFEDPERLLVEDKVTISSEARRQFNRMQMARNKFFLRR
jgi:hypothetical protein